MELGFHNVIVIIMAFIFVFLMFLSEKRNKLLQELVIGLAECNSYKTDFLLNLIKLYHKNCPDDNGEYDKLIESIGACKLETKECVCFAKKNR